MGLKVEFKNGSLIIDDGSEYLSRDYYTRVDYRCLVCGKKSLWQDSSDMECGEHVYCASCGNGFWFHEPMLLADDHPTIVNLRAALKTKAGRAARGNK